MADALQDLPYRAEYAKSGRASCKACKSTIQKESLRLAVMVQSHMFDGKVPHWYHYACFFTKQRPKAPGDIEHFDSLRWEDQEKLKQKIADGPGVAVSNSKSKGKASKRSLDSGKLKDFTIEYAKSSRAMCRGCEIKIAKEEVRISKKDFESDDAKRYGGKDLWHHVECFAKLRSELGFYDCGDCLPGFKGLKKEDQATVKKALPQIKQEANGDSVDGPSEAKKIKTEEKSESDKVLKKQNEFFFKLRDHLKELEKKELHVLLEYNGQAIPTGPEECLDRLADAMAFGALKTCEVCKTGQFVYKTGIGYQCEGDLSAYTKCLKIEPDPKRSKFKVPKDLMERYEFLEKYKPKVQKRIIVTLASTVKVKTEDETDSTGPKIDKAAPLRNMSFFRIGKLSQDKEMLKRRIVKMGGTLSSKLTPEITAVISSEAEIEKEGAKMEEVKKMGIHVIPESFFDECQEGKAIDLISEKAISSWGTSVQKRIDAGITKSGALKSSKSRFTKSVPSKVTLKLKGGLAVDPDSHLEDVAHVYVVGKTVYSTVLSRTNIQKSENSFYKLQVLQADTKKTYWLFRSWGRIGTTIGDSKVEKFNNQESAIDKFEELFQEKTGHPFCNLKTMTKLPDFYFPLDIDYGQEEDIKMDTTSSVPCKLAEPVQKLVSLLFDINLMKKVMLEFELDLEKMPLGKLSRKQINMAYSVLSELQKKDGDFKPATVVDATNRFYTIIPHNFGMDNPPLLDNQEILKSKLDMLESLMEMETAYRLLKETKDEMDSDLHPLDAHYTKLNTTVDVVDTTSEEFSIIEKYVKNTHAETHRTYQLEILHLYKVKRQGEDKRFKPFKKLHNRKLLWHGSRITNFAGILSQGLRIAPPEAPVTGYMFGKGIYFADMVSKSANYCMTSKDNSTGLLLLCEVALGEMYEKTHAEFVTQLPPGKHSTMGLGVTGPDPSESVTLEDGLEVPVGKGIKARDMTRTSLLYNEYIVYDPAQVRARYLLKVKFNYNY